MKVVVNKCYGGFSVSKKVYEELNIEWDGYGYLENKDFNIDDEEYYLQYRSHPLLISAIETLGEDTSSGSLAKLKIIEIPNDIDWYIDDYDGIESIHESHQSW